MAKGNPVTFRFPDNLDLESVGEKADTFGLTRSAFIAAAIELMMELDPDSYIKIKSYANKIGASVGLVMQNTTIKALAKKAAILDVWGHESETLLEYAKNDQDQYIIGDNLFYMLYGSFKSEEIQRRIKHLLTNEIYGDLEGEDKKFMIANRAGRAWETSEEYKKEKAELAAAYAKYNKNGELDQKNK